MILLLALMFLPAQGNGADWPMWRHDAQRSGTTEEVLTPELHLQWTRKLPRLKPTWPDQPKLTSDAIYEPIVAEGSLFVASARNDSLTAYDLVTGAEKWRAYADGPIRFAPLFWHGRIFFACDDGYLYCLDARDGTCLRKFRGGPSERQILGNGRLTSSWPARGAPVLKDGTIYFTASIWPFMGIFVHALDADTFEVEWTNDTTGSLYLTQPHNANAFAGLAPQGYLAAVADRLIVPNGRAIPACFDRQTGKLLYFHHARHARSGGYRVAASSQLFFCNGQAFDLASGTGIVSLTSTTPPTIEKNTFLVGGDHLVAYRNQPTLKKVKAHKGESDTRLVLEKVWQLDNKLGSFNVYLKAGQRLYGTQDREVVGVDVSATGPAQPRIVWRTRIDGTPAEMLAADGHLIVVTKEGRLCCFGPDRVAPTTYTDASPSDLPASDPQTTTRVAAILNATDVRNGYCVVLGLKDGRTLEELARQTNLHVVGVDADARKVGAIRRRLDAVGLYGDRVSVHASVPDRFPFPPYLASLILFEDRQAAGDTTQTAFWKHLFNVLRPYGGTICVQGSEKGNLDIVRAVHAADLPNAKVTHTDDVTRVTRAGALPGSADWTHQYADSANSVVSQDTRVKLPLGLLWFGGPSNEKVLPRHGHGPSPQVAGGRLIIEGPDLLRAVDVYTGRVLWEKSLPGLGTYYNITDHKPGAGEIGSNVVSLADKIYVAYGAALLILDAETGATTKKITMPADAQGRLPNWGYLSAWNGLLVATSIPVTVPAPTGRNRSGKQLSGRSRRTPGRNDAPVGQVSRIESALVPARYSSASRRLIVMNRHNGQVLWTRDAKLNFRHNGIVTAAGKIFCIDGLSPAKRESLKRRGIETAGQSHLLALDVYTGDEVWSTVEHVFGTFLNYSIEHDVLVQGGSEARDRAKDEVGQGLIAYRGSDGKVLWSNPKLKYHGPCLLWHDRIITNGTEGFQLDLLTGRKRHWSFARMYGCNTVVGSQNFLTFRSAAAGFCDLTGDSGTGNLGGFKSSCTSNLIAADGVLNAPDYTRTCLCGYQNQTSLAFIPMPEAEMWTFNKREFDEFNTRPRQIGINLGAPGDRRAANGTLWLEYPIVGGPSPKLDVTIEPADAQWFAHHSSRIEEAGDGPAWVAATGVIGAKSIVVATTNSSKHAEPYIVRLHFWEPEALHAGERRFSVQIQGKMVLENFDVRAATKVPNSTVVKTFSNIRIADTLRVQMQPLTPGKPPVLCGIEIIPTTD